MSRCSELSCPEQHKPSHLRYCTRCFWRVGAPQTDTLRTVCKRYAQRVLLPTKSYPSRLLASDRRYFPNQIRRSRPELRGRRKGLSEESSTIQPCQRCSAILLARWGDL